jgi:hypothetical protein
MSSAKKKNRTVPLKDIIAEEAAEAEQEELGQDASFDPDRDLGSAFHGPRAFARTMQDKDQLVIDELLASLPKNQGYYLKLYREILPGKWELKETINNYDTWTDMELEIAERVKAMTRKFGPKKWGSGLYRIVVWRQGGIRERNKYPPTDIIVDAGDDADAAENMHRGKVDPMEAANEQLHALGSMMAAVKEVMPKAVDPNVQFQAIVQAFTAGKEEKREAARQDANAMTTMMTTMMSSMMTLMTTMLQQRNGPVETSKPFEEQLTSMMNVMKGFGLGQQPQPKTLVEQITEMKMLGWDPTQKEDTIDQIAKLKAMTGALMDVMPSNGQAPERPGIFEKLVDALAPHVPKIFADMKAITENAALAQQMQRMRLAEAQPQPTPVERRPTTRYGQPVGPQPGRMGAGDAFNEQPDMDPYSGFHMRPFQDPTEVDAGIRDEMTGSVRGATAEELRAQYTGQPIVKPAATNGKPVPTNGQVVETLKRQAAEPAESQMPPMLQQLYLLIEENVVNAYGSLYEALEGDESSVQIIRAIQQQQLDGDGLVQQLQLTGFSEFQNQPFVGKAQQYLSGFVKWVLENTGKRVVAVCQNCMAEHIFESLFEFTKYPTHQCGAELSGMETCNGHLKLKSAMGAAHVVSA